MRTNKRLVDALAARAKQLLDEGFVGDFRQAARKAVKDDRQTRGKWDAYNVAVILALRDLLGRPAEMQESSQPPAQEELFDGPPPEEPDGQDYCEPPADTSPSISSVGITTVACRYAEVMDKSWRALADLSVAERVKAMLSLREDPKYIRRRVDEFFEEVERQASEFAPEEGDGRE